MALQNICGFSSPQLAAAANGAAPTFAFATTNTNYFALQGQFTAIIGVGACTFPTSSAYTPLIVGGGLTRTCNVLSGSSTYTDIACPTAINNQFSAGTYQLSFTGNGAPFISSDFIVALPTTSIVSATATQTVLVTATATVDPSGHVITPSVLPSVASSTPYSTSLPGSSSMSVSSTPGVPNLPSISLPSIPSITVTSLSATSNSATQSTVSSHASSQPTSSSTRSLSTSSSELSSLLSPTRSASLSSSTRASSSSSSTKIPSTSSSTKVSSSSATGKTSSVSSTKISSTSSTKLISSSTKISSVSSNKLSSSSSSRLSTLSTVITRTSSSLSSTPTLKISSDATCGGKTGFTCKGSRFGDCCSQYGYCGSSSGYCDTGCNALAGTCKSQSVPSNVPSTPSLKVSKDAKCGGKTEQTCKGSAFGSCCSKNGWCGSTSDYCGSGCLSGFGDCKTPRFAVRADPSGAGPDFTYPPIPTSTVYVATVTVTVTVATVTVTVTPGVAPAIPTSIDASSLASANQPPISSSASLPSTDVISTPSAFTSLDVPSSSTSVCPTPTLAPGAFSTVVPKNFCLKVLTPCVTSTDWLIKQGPVTQDNGPFFIDPTVGGNFTNVMRFELREDKQLLVTTPGQAANTVARFSGGTAGMFRYSPEVSFLNNVTCVVRTDVPDYLGYQILKCTGVNQRRTYTDFRHSKFWDGDTRLYSTSDYVANPPDLPNDFRIELGLYTGGTCPEDPPIASSSALDASSTPSASASNEFSTPSMSASDVVSTPSSSAMDAISTTLAVDAVSTTLAPSSPDPTTLSSLSVSACPTPTLAAGPYATVVPHDFCLRVLTPCVSSSGWLVKQGAVESNNGNFQLDPATGGIVGYVARFSIDNPTGQLFITTPGLQGYKVAGYSTGTGGMFRWRDESANLNNVTCITRTDVPNYEGYQVLKCSGKSRSTTLTEFRHYNFLEGLTHLFGSNDDTTNTPTNFRIELGVFTGGDCPNGPAFSPAPEPTSSTSDILSNLDTPTPSPIAESPSAPASSTSSPALSTPLA